MTLVGYQFEAALLVSLFVFIASLIWVQQCYFRRRWLPFIALFLCVLLSSVFLFILLHQLLFLPAQPDLTPVVRQPTTPL
jgi:hypothetical protein